MQHNHLRSLVAISRCLLFAACTVWVAANAASAQVCGDGVTDTGEQCDFAATPSGLDECDGCATDCTITEECGVGPCQDLIDNDGDGKTDSADDLCASFTDSNSIAAIALSPRKGGVKLKRDSRVVPGIFSTDPTGEVCTRGIDIRDRAVVEGNVTALDDARISHRFSSGIGGVFAMTSGELPNVRRAPHFVGTTLGTCSTSLLSCYSPQDCTDPNRETCDGREVLGNVSSFVDLEGTGAGTDQVARCGSALATLEATAAQLATFGEDSDEDLKLGKREELIIQVDSGLTVINLRRVRLGADSLLILDGPADATVLFRVGSTFRLVARSEVLLSGGLQAGNVLWLLVNNRPSAYVSNYATLPGVIFGPERKVLIQRGATVKGAIIGAKVDLGRDSRIEHIPFSGLMPADIATSVVDSNDPVAAGGSLTYDVALTNEGVSGAGALNLTVDLDAQTTFTSAVPDSGVCSHDGSGFGGTVTCALGELPTADPNDPTQHIINVAVLVGVDGGASGSLSATFAAAHSVAEVDPNDNVVVVDTAVGP